MTDLRTAAQQALEALERCVSTCFDQYAHEQVMSRPEHFVNQTITALRAALAEPQIDPVDKYRKGFIAGQIDMRDREQAEPVQEPVAWALHTGTRQGIKWNRRVEHGTPLYAAQPQRKPLVDPAEYDDAGAAERYNRGLK